MTHSKIAVVGAGTAGQNVCAQLARSGKVNDYDITIFDPSADHHYQAAYTMVAGGVLGSAEKTKSHYEDSVIVRPQNELFKHTPGVQWQQKAVVSFDPSNNELTLNDGSKATYDYLIVNPGLKLRYDKIEGAQEALDDPDCPVGSMYYLKGAYKTSVLRENFRGGNAIFTCPPFPIKCGGAP